MEIDDDEEEDEYDDDETDTAVVTTIDHDDRRGRRGTRDENKGKKKRRGSRVATAHTVGKVCESKEKYSILRNLRIIAQNDNSKLLLSVEMELPITDDSRSIVLFDSIVDTILINMYLYIK